MTTSASLVEAPGAQPAAPGLDQCGADWAGRRVVVVGLARSGVAACRLLQQAGSRVRVTELRRNDATQQFAEELSQAGVEAVELGDHRRELLEGCEIMVVSPGVPETTLPIQWAHEHGVPIVSEVELAFRFCPAPIIAVSGTNGKSTAVTLIHNLLTACGRSSVVCGNIGIPFSSMIPSLQPEMTVVLEVSSFQLLGCERFRPSIGLLLNLGTNHLDRHPDRAHYVAAKARLFQRQTADDYAVLNHTDPEVVEIGRRVAAQRVWFGDSGLENSPRFRLHPSTCRALPANLQAVLQVGRILGIPDPLTHQIIREFKGLEHRIEYVATIRGVTYLNDAKSTTPESCLYALGRCAGPVVAIVGGKDKGLDFQSLQATLTQLRIRGVVLIGETRPTLRALLNGSSHVRECDRLDEAVRVAAELARPGDTVLFSPACASFDMFKNFEERGTRFKACVRDLAAAQPAGPIA